MPRAVLYFTGEAIEDDDNVGGLGAGVAVGPVQQASALWSLGRRHGRGVLGVEHPVPESACAVTPFRVSSRPTGSLLHARRVAGVTSRRGDCHAVPRGDSQS